MGDAMRKVCSITGSRADYGLMQPVYRAIASEPALTLDLVVTGMHFLPEFAASLAEVRGDGLGTLHELPEPAGRDDGLAMAVAIGRRTEAIAAVFDRIRPDIILLQGDRGEMLSAAIAAAHMDIPIVHMSGGDVSGTIDDSVRNAISKFAHFHLTNSAPSSRRLLEIGEPAARILEVGEPGLDQLLQLEPVPRTEIEAKFALTPGEPYLVATMHPVTGETDQARLQMRTLLQALETIGLPAIFTHPNSDAGGREMRDELESWSGRAFLRILPHAGSRLYLSLVRHAAAVVGNSSSGLFDTPTLRVPAVNIGSRQTGRLRAENVIDAPALDAAAIARAVDHALHDPAFRLAVQSCRNPFGDGHAAERTVAVLKSLRLDPTLTAKWQPVADGYLAVPVAGVPHGGNAPS
jgi:UDP-hydrolysing UDP-N-acetyl-D-glucosamine 2-epimerase